MSHPKNKTDNVWFENCLLVVLNAWIIQVATYEYIKLYECMYVLKSWLKCGLKYNMLRTKIIFQQMVGGCVCVCGGVINNNYNLLRIISQDVGQ